MMQNPYLSAALRQTINPPQRDPLQRTATGSWGPPTQAPTADEVADAVASRQTQQQQPQEYLTPGVAPQYVQPTPVQRPPVLAPQAPMGGVYR